VLLASGGAVLDAVDTFVAWVVCGSELSRASHSFLPGRAVESRYHRRQALAYTGQQTCLCHRRFKTRSGTARRTTSWGKLVAVSKWLRGLWEPPHSKA